MFLVFSCSCLRSILWSQVWSWEWRCSWKLTTDDAPTTTELSTILLPTKVRLILEVLRYVIWRHQTTTILIIILSTYMFCHMTPGGIVTAVSTWYLQMVWRLSETNLSANIMPNVDAWYTTALLRYNPHETKISPLQCRQCVPSSL